MQRYLMNGYLEDVSLKPNPSSSRLENYEKYHYSFAIFFCDGHIRPDTDHHTHGFRYMDHGRFALYHQ